LWFWGTKNRQAKVNDAFLVRVIGQLTFNHVTAGLQQAPIGVFLRSRKVSV
jgi:hypothetical protein